MTLLTSLLMREVRRMHRPSLFSRVLYTTAACLSTGFSRIFFHISQNLREATSVPRVKKMEVSLIDNKKKTKKTKKTNTENTENTKNTKNAKNCK